jgi:hypothetical protein
MVDGDTVGHLDDARASNATITREHAFLHSSSLDTLNTTVFGSYDAARPLQISLSVPGLTKMR